MQPIYGYKKTLVKTTICYAFSFCIFYSVSPSPFLFLTIPNLLYKQPKSKELSNNKLMKVLNAIDALTIFIPKRRQRYQQTYFRRQRETKSYKRKTEAMETIIAIEQCGRK